MTPRRRNKEFGSLRGFFASCDLTQMVLLALLLGIGLLFIYSTGVNAMTGMGIEFFYRQLAWITLGWCGYFLLARIDYRNWQWLSPFFYLGCLALLVIVLLWGEKISGARRWLNLGIMNFQPSELTKLALVVLLATLFSRDGFNINKTGSLALAGGLVALPFLLIFKEPDLGSAAILLPLAAVLVYAAGLKNRILAVAAILVVVAGTLLAANEYFGIHPLLKEYHRERIRVFFNPESDPLARGYQQHQARLALGSGGWTGKGLGNGTQHLLGFLPQSAANNDFIFSVIAEESGFLGTGALLLLYVLLLGSVLRCSLRCEEPFGRLLSLGIGAFLFIHVFINISVNIGLTPVKGLSLPFISYGGSFVLICMAAMGIVQSIYRFGKEED